MIGLTKAEKTFISNIFANLLKADIIEMSEPFRKNISNHPTLEELLNSMNDFRLKNGRLSLIDIALKKIYESKKNIILVGLRNYDEYLFLKKNINNVITVFIYSSMSTRYFKLCRDTSSIAKNLDDYKLLDEIALLKEGFSNVVLYSDYIIVNEPDYPITLKNQVKNIVKKI